MVRVEDYEPVCVLKLPLLVDGRLQRWTKGPIRSFDTWFRQAMGNDEPVDLKIYHSTESHYYDNTKYTFLYYRFSSLAAMYHCKALISKREYKVYGVGTVKAVVRESNIDAIHRMISERELGYGQWFTCEGTIPDHRISRGCTEYIASCESLKPIDSSETLTWETHPIVMAFDIETTSENHNRFPDQDHINDASFQISIVVKRMGVGVMKNYLVSTRPCDPIEGTEVINVEDEMELNFEFCRLIIECDPSIIVGYNNYKFDIQYLDARLKLYGEEWGDIGLIVDQKPWLRIVEWASSAYSKMTIADLNMEGRVMIDLMLVIKRDYKLNNYKLETVAQEFLKEGKDDISPKEMFEEYDYSVAAFKGNDERKKAKSRKRMAVVGKYCMQDSILCIKLMEKLNFWISSIEMATICGVKLIDLTNRGQQVRVRNLLFSMLREDEVVFGEREGTGKYPGAHVFDPVVGKHDNVICLDFASLYPSIIIAYNICISTFVPPESSIPDEDCNIIDTVIGKLRFIKKEIFYGYLPRFCERAIKARRETRKMIGPHNDAVTNTRLNARQLALKITANSGYGVLGIKTGGNLSFPECAIAITAMGQILIKRASTYIEEEYNGEISYGDTDSIMINIGLKDPNDVPIWGNRLSKELTALYNDPLVLEYEKTFAVALFVTKKKYAGVLLEEIKMGEGDRLERVNSEVWRVIKGDKVVYLKMGEGAKPEGREIVAGILLDGDLEPDESRLMVKGIILARRDNCAWMRGFYKRLLLHIMYDGELDYALEICDEEVWKLLGRCDDKNHRKLLFTTEVRKNYKPGGSYFVKTFVDMMRRKGRIIPKGERFDYMYVRCEDEDELKAKSSSKKAPKGLKMRLWEDYWENCYVEPLDLGVYIEKVTNSIQQLLGIAYGDELDARSAHLPPKRGNKKLGIVGRKRGKIYTCESREYMETWSKLYNYKSELIKSIPLAYMRFYDR